MVDLALRALRLGRPLAVGPRPARVLAAGVAATFVAIGVVWLFAASWAFADDTRQQSDGYGNAAAAAAAGAAAGALAAASAGRRKPASDPELNKKRRDWYDRELERQKKDPMIPNNPDLQRLHEDYLKRQRDYWADPPELTSDGKSPDDHSVSSSGVGTRG